MRKIVGLGLLAVIVCVAYWALRPEAPVGSPDLPPASSTGVREGVELATPASGAAEDRMPATTQREGASGPSPQSPGPTGSSARLPGQPEHPPSEDDPTRPQAGGGPAEGPPPSEAGGEQQPPWKKASSSAPDSFVAVAGSRGRRPGSGGTERLRPESTPADESSAPTDDSATPDRPRPRPHGDDANSDDPNDATVQVHLNVGGHAGEIGETVRVDIMISGASDVVDVPFNLSYDPNVLGFMGAQEGAFLRFDGTSTLFLVRDNARQGVVRFGMSRFDRAQGASGTGMLAQVDFQLKSLGGSALEFSSQAVRDSQGNLLPASFVGTLVN